MECGSPLSDDSRSSASPQPSPPSPTLSSFCAFLRAAFDVAEEDTIARTPTQEVILKDRDRYLPFRQLGPSKRVILNDPNGPFSPARMKTQEGFFDALIFRLITQASPILVQEKQVCFGSPPRFSNAIKGKEQRDYCNPSATGQHSRFSNIPHIANYWKHAAGWSNLVDDASFTFKSLLTWLTGHEGKEKRFFGMGSLAGWLLASDYAHAGLIETPQASEVGRIIFKINAGGKGGLALLGYDTDTNDACAEAMESLCTVVDRFFSPDDIKKMGLDPISLEHALCKFKRLYQMSIASVSWHFCSP